MRVEDEYEHESEHDDETRVEDGYEHDDEKRRVKEGNAYNDDTRVEGGYEQNTETGVGGICMSMMMR
jgi:hypothetical protein